MFPLPRVGDALLAHWPNNIRLRRACQSILRNSSDSATSLGDRRKMWQVEEFLAFSGIEENRNGVLGEEKHRGFGFGRGRNALRHRHCGSEAKKISADGRSGTGWHRNHGEKARSIPAWTSAAMSLDKKAWVLRLRICGLRFSAQNA